MRRTLFFAVLASFTFAATSFAQTAASRMAPGKGWLNDLERGKALAAKTGKPLMVVIRCDP